MAVTLTIIFLSVNWGFSSAKVVYWSIPSLRPLHKITELINRIKSNSQQTLLFPELLFFISALTIHSISFVLWINILKLTREISVDCNELGYRVCAAWILHAWIHLMPELSLVPRLCPPQCFTPIKNCNVASIVHFLRRKDQTESLILARLIILIIWILSLMAQN